MNKTRMVKKMEPLIQEIIAMDKAARTKVAQCEAKQNRDKAQIEALKQAEEKAAHEAAEKRLEERKKQNEEALKAMRETMSRQYEAASKQLNDRFAAKQAEWIQDLVQRCIGK